MHPLSEEQEAGVAKNNIKRAFLLPNLGKWFTFRNIVNGNPVHGNGKVGYVKFLDSSVDRALLLKNERGEIVCSGFEKAGYRFMVKGGQLYDFNRFLTCDQTSTTRINPMTFILEVVKLGKSEILCGESQVEGGPSLTIRCVPKLPDLTIITNFQGPKKKGALAIV